MNADELLNAANDLIERSREATTGWWPRGAAFLAREALEAAMDGLWRQLPETASMTRCSARTQLLCLSVMIDTNTAHEAGYVWSALSSACHYHPYELSPTAAELRDWLDIVGRVVRALDVARAKSLGR